MKLHLDFETLDLAQHHLKRQGFLQDPYVKTAWENPKTGYMAWTCRTQPNDMWMITFYPPLHVRSRKKDPFEAYKPRIKCELSLVGTNYK